MKNRSDPPASRRAAIGAIRKSIVSLAIAVVALLARLERERKISLWSDWLSTHPSPGARLESAKEACS